MGTNAIFGLKLNVQHQNCCCLAFMFYRYNIRWAETAKNKLTAFNDHQQLTTIPIIIRSSWDWPEKSNNLFLFIGHQILIATSFSLENLLKFQCFPTFTSVFGFLPKLQVLSIWEISKWFFFSIILNEGGSINGGNENREFSTIRGFEAIWHFIESNITIFANI